MRGNKLYSKFIRYFFTQIVIKYAYIIFTKPYIVSTM